MEDWYISPVQGFIFELCDFVQLRVARPFRAPIAIDELLVIVVV